MIDSIKKLFIGICYVVGFYLVILFLVIIGKYSNNLVYDKHNVEENTVITDSITKVNDSIKIKVEHLDSIKNAKVIEVKSLDNDSTLRLFYQLIGK